tara:strand:+ start:1054 stop:1962 length:909 start_codon:yes stop_codon:yes gene_type:complete
MVTTTEYLQREAPDIEARKLGLMDTAKALADNPLVLPAQQVANLSPEQLQAIQLGSQGIGSYQPFLANALQSQAAGLGTLGQAASAYTDIGTAPTMEQLQPFMNPYQQSIQDEINRSFNIAQQGAAANAIGAGAFGGGREGVQRAELERNRASALAQSQAQNFLNAQNQFGARQQTSAAGLGSLAPEYGRFGAQQAQLGITGQQAGGQDINTLLGLGALGQQQAQSSLDVARQNALSQMYEPYQRVGFLSDIYQGAPTSTQTIQTSTAPAATSSMSPLRTIAGYGALGLGALSGLSGIQGLF